MSDTAKKLLSSIRDNIGRIYQELKSANKEELVQLTRELKIARNQEREAKKYV